MKFTSALFLTLSLLLAGVAVAENSAEKKGTVDNPYTLSELMAGISELEKQEIVFTGMIIGACKSGCKMWISEGEYTKGDPFVLVRAKDDKFKFDTTAAGKTAVLRGFAIAKYMDYCAESGKEQEGAMDECEAPVKTAEQIKKEKAREPAQEEAAKKAAKQEAAGEKELKELTFFATSIEYHEARVPTESSRRGSGGTTL
jgi:hypothetical protein